MTTPVSSSAAAAASLATESSASIALKIRTLDQKTYPIVVPMDASVPQLKEAVASETGVVLARQRLIFRGKVLKNDQSIAAYALEDGHVLHLVVRAEDAPADQPDQQGQQQQQQQQQPSATTRNRPAAPRNNDEPDPTLGGSPHQRVVMGATIAVPDDMPMPFLNSVIANFVNSMGSAAAGVVGGAEPDQQRTQRNREMLRRLRRARQSAENAAGERAGGSRRRGREGSGGGDAAGTAAEAMSFSSSLSGNMLRDSAESQLRRLETSLSNSDFDLPDFPAREEAEAADVNRDAEVVQAQLAQLRNHIAAFGLRMDRLPAALREIGWYTRQQQEAPAAIVSSTVGAIDTLQSVGDSAATIARFARHVFLANSPSIPAPTVRIDERGRLRATMSFPTMGGAGSGANRDAGGDSVLPGVLPRTPVQRHQTLGLLSMPLPRPASTGNGTTNNNASATPDTAESPGVLRSLYQRVTSGLLGSRSGEGRPESDTAASGSATSTTASGSPAVLHPDEDSMNRFTIAALSNPFHPVFPLSFPSGGGLFPPPDRTNRPEWDVAGLWQRLARDLRAATAIGVLRGDPVAVYDLMRSLATIFVAGAYTPSLTSTPIRVWARRFLIAVRRVLGEQTIPLQVLELTPDRSSSRLIEELTRPLDPFMPELIDHIRRSNSASQGDAFGRSCTEFFRNMASQFIARVRTYVNDNDDDATQATRLLEGILVALEVEAGLAAYMVERLMAFGSPATRATRRTGDSHPDAPDAKRARRE